MMTKTEARKLARHARAFGYYQAPPGAEYEVSVDCPLCRTRLGAIRNSRYVPARPGEPWSAEVDGRRCKWVRESVNQALDRTVTEHLLIDCPEVIR
jgi:hypothetical protein